MCRKNWCVLSSSQCEHHPFITCRCCWGRLGLTFWVSQCCGKFILQYIITINHNIYRYVYLYIISLSIIFYYHYYLSFPFAPSIFLPWGNCWLPYGKGITVCAIGTSFPNAVASVLMAQQNKPAAAIANALGSNVQNVFLAMALPWVSWIIHGGMFRYVTSPQWAVSTQKMVDLMIRNYSPP